MVFFNGTRISNLLAITPVSLCFYLAVVHVAVFMTRIHTIVLYIPPVPLGYNFGNLNLHLAEQA